jgi:hypothetical protein
VPRSGSFYQQVHVFRHDYVSLHAEAELLANTLQGGFEDGARRDAFEIWPSVIAAESEEVELTRLVEALQSPRHVLRLSPATRLWSVTVEHPAQAELGRGTL